MTLRHPETASCAKVLALSVVLGLIMAGGYVATGQRWFEISSFAFASSAMFCAGVILSRDVSR